MIGIISRVRSTMAIATVISPFRLAILFYLGWTPVFLLALTGSTLEIMGHNSCPLSPAGIPLCYFSLTIATFLLPAFVLVRSQQREADSTV
jgi:hypothetical protein